MVIAEPRGRSVGENVLVKDSTAVAGEPTDIWVGVGSSSDEERLGCSARRNDANKPTQHLRRNS